METDKITEEKDVRALIVTAYMEHVLLKEVPQSVFSFCKDQGFEESEFYQHFGSLEGLKKIIWADFYLIVEGLLLENSEFNSFTNRDKLLTFYYTFFELLTANRSYVLVALKMDKEPLKNLKQLTKLRAKIKDFGADLANDGNEAKKLKITKKPVRVISEAVWIQFLLLLKFWVEDESPAFEKTDIAIEKSVNTVFDVFDNTPLDSIIDLGKFLWKEKMTS